MCGNYLSSAVVDTNEHEIPAIPPVPLVGSSPFCVSVLYPNCAQSRSVENEMPTAYCVKCKTSIEIKDPQNVMLKNCKQAVIVVYLNLGTKVFRIGNSL